MADKLIAEKRQAETIIEELSDNSETESDVVDKKKKRWMQKYKDSYSGEWPVINRSTRGVHFAFCSVCQLDFSISHGGRDDCRRHVSSKRHTEFSSIKKDSKPISSFFSSSRANIEIIKAETLFTSFLVEHNLPISAADHATKLFKKMFPDSSIAKKYSCGRTKSTAIIKELSSDVQSQICEYMTNMPFSLSTDGSTDTAKLYPLIVKCMNQSSGLIDVALLSVPSLSGDATGLGIYNLLNSELEKRGLDWHNCVAFGSDNANVMTGKYRGVIAYVRKNNPAIYLCGCPCHLLHLAAEKAAKELPVRVDEILIDIYYYLDKSTKRLSSLTSFQDLCGTQQRKILKHVSTRWLSLGTCIDRLLQQWEPLSKFFAKELGPNATSSANTNSSTNISSTSTSSSTKVSTISGVPNTSSKSVKSTSGSSNDRHSTSKSNTKASSSKTKSTASTSSVSVSSTSSASKISTSSSVKSKSTITKTQTLTTVPKSTSITTTSTTASKAPQSYFNPRERVARVNGALLSHVFRLYCLFLKNAIPIFDNSNQALQATKPLIHKTRRIIHDFIRQLFLRFLKPESLVNLSVTEVKYTDRTNQKDDDDLLVGSQVKDYIKDNKANGLSRHDIKVFHVNVRRYFEKACEYSLTKLPVTDELLLHAEVLDVTLRTTVKFSSLQYFLTRFPCLLPHRDTVHTDELELEFCTYQADSFTSTILDCDRIDMQWHLIGQLCDSNGALKYSRLCNVMKGIMVIPHSNADCERVFSAVTKNFTDFRPNMSSETLESLLVLKARGTVCYDQDLSDKLLTRAKSATWKALQQ